MVELIFGAMYIVALIYAIPNVIGFVCDCGKSIETKWDAVIALICGYLVIDAVHSAIVWASERWVY